MITSAWELESDFELLSFDFFIFNIKTENMKVILNLQFATHKMNIDTNLQFWKWKSKRENDLDCSMFTIESRQLLGSWFKLVYKKVQFENDRMDHFVVSMIYLHILINCWFISYVSKDKNQIET